MDWALPAYVALPLVCSFLIVEQILHTEYFFESTSISFGLIKSTAINL